MNDNKFPLGVVHKEFTIQKDPNGKVTVSTAGLDRQSDRVLGLRLGNYERNPVVLWGHNYADPFAVIGRATEVEPTQDGLKLLPVWRPPASPQDPMHIIQLLWDQDFVRAFSIGFQPLKWKDNDSGGLDFLDSELLEVSLVPVPANADALRAMAKGLAYARDQGLDTRAWVWPDAAEFKAQAAPQGLTWPSAGTLQSDTTATLSDGEKAQAFIGRVMADAEQRLVQDPITGTWSDHNCSTAVAPSGQYAIQVYDLAAPGADPVDCVCRNCGSDFQATQSVVKLLTARGLPFLCDQCKAQPQGDDLAWVRRLEVETNTGVQLALACFSPWVMDIPEDATKLDFDPDTGDLTEIPHPDAGQTIKGLDCFYVPPIPFYSEKWGEDAVWSTGGRDATDERLVQSDAWDVRDLSDVLLTLPRESLVKGLDLDGSPHRGLGICQLTYRGIRAAKALVQKRLGLDAPGQDGAGLDLDGSPQALDQDARNALGQALNELKGVLDPTPRKEN